LNEVNKLVGEKAVVDIQLTRDAFSLGFDAPQGTQIKRSARAAMLPSLLDHIVYA
jgi:hypothetical protein